MQQTLIIAKPDAVQRGLIGAVLGRLEQRGLRIVALKFLQIDRELAERHYAEHRGKPFFAGLVEYIISTPVALAVFEGPNAVAAARATMGATNPLVAATGTIRGDYGLEISRNLVHGSDSVESAGREISLYFRPEEVVTYRRAIDQWVSED
ncbi:MAG: nucleoside-diphosphate kinase [Chloroflexota bacterium]